MRRVSVYFIIITIFPFIFLIWALIIVTTTSFFVLTIRKHYCHPSILVSANTLRLNTILSILY